MIHLETLSPTRIVWITDLASFAGPFLNGLLHPEGYDVLSLARSRGASSPVAGAIYRPTPLAARRLSPQQRHAHLASNLPPSEDDPHPVSVGHPSPSTGGSPLGLTPSFSSTACVGFNAVHLRPFSSPLFPPPPQAPLSRTLFQRLMQIEKSAGGLACQQPAKPGRGSLQRLSKIGLLYIRGAETCPLSAITLLFSLSPKKCPGERPCSPTTMPLLMGNCLCLFFHFPQNPHHPIFPISKNSPKFL